VKYKIEEVSMVLKRILIVFSLILSITLFFADFAMAQMNPIYKFKDVSIPVSLKIKDKLLEKGAYNLEFCRASNGPFYYVRIMKKKEVLVILEGEEFRYGIAKDRNIPNKPTLKMTRNQSEKLLILVFESGTVTKIYPMLRARFKIQYDE
jgi:hypothetical protein